MVIPDQALVQISHTHREVLPCEIIDHVGSDLVSGGGGIYPFGWDTCEEPLG